MPSQYITEVSYTHRILGLASAIPRQRQAATVVVNASSVHCADSPPRAVVF